MGFIVLLIVFIILTILFIIDSEELSNFRFENRQDGFYFIYDQRIFNKIEGRFLTVTKNIKLF